MTPAQLHEHFAARFGLSPRLFRAPGRVNLIGEHTDYNQGLALAGAIDRACYVAAAPANDRRIEAIALNRSEQCWIDLDADQVGRPELEWEDFVRGAAQVTGQLGGACPGAKLVIWSDVPVGAGVSSSAALCVGLMLALSTLAGAPLRGMALAHAAQRVERDHIGVPCGLMDQWASACGAEGQVLAMDFHSLESELTPLASDVAILILDSGVRHANSDGDYESVARACHAAAKALGVSSLRTAKDYSGLPASLLDKALYVRDENLRVTKMVAAFRSGDHVGAGALLGKSHNDLRDRFGVVVPETDVLAAVARAQDGVFGARQMGAGFGGSVVALCANARANHALDSILHQTHADAKRRANSFVARLAAGASEIRP